MIKLTLNLLDDVNGPDVDPDAVEALRLVARVLAEEEGVVSGEVSLMVHADTATLHPEKMV